MASLADHRGCVTASLSTIASKAGIDANNVSGPLYALEKKGWVMMAKPTVRNGNSYVPSIWQLLRQPDDVAA